MQLSRSLIYGIQLEYTSLSRLHITRIRHFLPRHGSWSLLLARRHASLYSATHQRLFARAKELRDAPSAGARRRWPAASQKAKYLGALESIFRES